MAKLKKAGLVATRSGSVGGYHPLIPPGALTLDRIADALEVRFVEPAWHSGGADLPCMVASGMAGVMDGLFDELNDRCRAKLAQLTLADLEGRLVRVADGEGDDRGL